MILTGLDGLQPDTAASLLYVGITRARSHLVIVERAEVLARWGLAGRSAERTQNVRGVG